jgi:hypothetical protein
VRPEMVHHESSRPARQAVAHNLWVHVPSVLIRDCQLHYSVHCRRYHLRITVLIALKTACMASRIPTEVGDVIILVTSQSFTTHAVGRVSKDGQQDVHSQAKVKHVRDRDTAVAAAKALVASGRRIFYLNLDTGEWSEVSL